MRLGWALFSWVLSGAAYNVMRSRIKRRDKFRTYWKKRGYVDNNQNRIERQDKSRNIGFIGHAAMLVFSELFLVGGLAHSAFRAIGFFNPSAAILLSTLIWTMVSAIVGYGTYKLHFDKSEEENIWSSVEGLNFLHTRMHKQAPEIRAGDEHGSSSIEHPGTTSLVDPIALDLPELSEARQAA